MANKRPTNFRLSEEALELLSQWSQRLGISRSGILELAIREFDCGRGTQPEPKAPEAPQVPREAG